MVQRALTTRLLSIFLPIAALVGMGPVASPLRADAPSKAASVRPSVITSAQSGLWSSPATWKDGRIPRAGARVLIRTGHRVVYDSRSDQAIRAIIIAGTLTFAPDKDTRLDVGLIKIQAGEELSEEGFDCEAHLATPDPRKARPTLAVGTIEKPIEAGPRLPRRHESGLVSSDCLLRRTNGLSRGADEPHLAQARQGRPSTRS
jgi:hypothetical protein